MSCCYDFKVCSPGAVRVIGGLLLLLSFGCGLTAVLVARSITYENVETDRVYVVTGMLGGAFVFVFAGSWSIMEILTHFTLTQKVTNKQVYARQMRAEMVDLVAAFSMATATFWTAVVLFVQSKTTNYWIGSFVLGTIILCSFLIFLDHTFLFRAMFYTIPYSRKLVAAINPEAAEERKKTKAIKKEAPGSNYIWRKTLEEAQDQFDYY